MATVVTLTVRPSGGDFSLVSTAVGSIPSDIVSVDEQYDVLCDTFTGGLNDGFDFPSITSDATRFVRIAAASGHEFNPVDGSGFFMQAFRNFDGVITNLTTLYLRLENIGFMNTGGSSTRGVQGNQNFCQYLNCYASGGTLSNFSLDDGDGIVVENCLAVGTSIGFDLGNFSSGTVTNCTAIDNTTGGFNKDSGGSGTHTLVNCLYIGSGAFASGTNTANMNGNNNAGSDTTTIGTSPLNNRTTADLADYANDDYRTASASALATAGSGGTFIGYALESGGGTGITINEELKALSIAAFNPAVTLTGGLLIQEQLKMVSYSSFNPNVTLTGVVSVSEQLKGIQLSPNNPIVDLTGSVEISEQLKAIAIDSIDPVITLTPKPIEITESLTSYQYAAKSPSILLTPEPIGIVSTVCFDGVLVDISFDGTTSNISFDGELASVSFDGNLKELEFNGTIDVNCNNGSIKTDC